MYRAVQELLGFVRVRRRFWAAAGMARHIICQQRGRQAEGRHNWIDPV
jgi:hypothetical protein